MGYINILCLNAYYGAGIDKNYFLVDNGITAFVFIYGIVGLIWLLIWFLKILKDGFNIAKNKKEYTYLLYIVHIVVLLPNIIWWYWSTSGMIVLMLIFALIENEKFNL